MVIMSVTYASLIFAGDLQLFLGDGIALALTSVIVVGALLTLLSSSTHLISQIDDDTAPVFALLLAMLAGSLPVGVSSAELLSTLLAGIFSATLISGLVLAAFGTFKFGNFIQFLPYSVMGGYFAAVGWLLLVGALSMLSGNPLSSIEDIKHLFDSPALALWLPAVVLGAALRLMSRHLSSGILLGGFVVVATVVFFITHGATGSSPQQLMEQGLLLGPFEQQSRSLLNFSNPYHWNQATLSVVATNIGSIASITLISLLSIVLGMSGLSISTRQDLDVNHELKVSGFANLVSAAVGGMSALPSLTISKLSFEIHPRANRAIGIIAVSFCILVFYFGMDLVAHIPKLVLGALLIYIGLGFAIDWIIDGYRKFGALEYSVIPIILLVSIFAGFLTSILAGVVAAIILFVVKYSRIKIIRYQASGADLRSNLIRDSEQNKVLSQHGTQIRLFTLQGYLFFGTAGSLYRGVLEVVDDANNEVRYVILDFSQVIGVDSSATLNFEKLAQRLAERKIYLITTSLRPDVLEILRRGGLDLSSNAYLIQHTDIDQGMEWCENYILREQHTEAQQLSGIFERMAESLPHSTNLHRLKRYLDLVEVKAGQVLARLGELSDEVFFLESCTASAFIVDSHGAERRVSGAGRGAIYGEIGFFLGIPRTALVRADSNGELYSLSRSALAEMEKQDPELAAALIRHLAQVVTERLVNTTQSLRSML